MRGRLEGKVAIVVGAGQFPGESVGTGRATALRFMQEGASVLAVDRSLESAEETLRISGDDARDSQALQADVTDTESLQRAAEAAMARWDRIDILFYNVGVSIAGGDKPLDEITDEIFGRVMDINLRGAVMAAKYVVPFMRKQRSGAVINLASVSAIETTRPNITYRTSKAGLIAFTQQLAIQNAAYGVRANAILPGVIDTPMSVDQRVSLLGGTREELSAKRNREVPLRGKQGTGWDVANAALFLASEEAAFITGVSLPVDGGMLMRIGY
ncbi:3-oxoacyl-ACP reductase [Variovorax sp. WS11]|uniref:SDR family NAD(P)-dependent oxidoreductase n=1 Tax=Variovorax sp. WS11 TaxID=1105204 RepID=UPI000D0CB213|nr:SDR family NAD(P)-dependent oxidoreductase [Variovorax sp. WS11]NDZ18770.1 SDR family oxidoreductase [Variovorax sp. WS11]PSL82547.1 3-oxoacyl-ACP reductase [Variovorax sp. WS11]